MFSALILSLLVAGLVVASRRWPDVEKRLWPDAVGTIPQKDTAEPPAGASADSVAVASVPAKGGFSHKPLGEPAADPNVLEKRAPKPAEKSAKPDRGAEPAPQPTATSAVIDDIERRKQHLIDETTVPAATTSGGSRGAASAAEPPPAASGTGDEAAETPEKPPIPTTPRPGAHVTGKPALPSQPAYLDATTRGAATNLDELGRQADQAYRDRQYEKAEQACLKILLKDPRNHKYMTRIGQVYQEMGQLEDARDAFEAAKALDPKNFFVLNRLTEVTRQLEEKASHAKN